MSAPRPCPQCGAPIPAGAAEGLCPRCLLALNLATQTRQAGETQPPAGGPAVLPLPLEDVAKLFPQLEIIRLVGTGGMGAVYQARQPALDRHVALKLLHTPPADDPGFAERFAQEARALAKLNHPNIVALHEFGQAGGRPYFLMEFVDGVNLCQLQQAGRLSPREALSIVPQVCDALQYAHDEGVVHRDIKPENVLVDRKGRVKVADFGLAKLMGMETTATRLTGAGHVMGTPHYMAPEQVEHPLEVDHRADIFSLGVVFYELLTGELPLGKFPLPSKKVRIDVRLDEVVLRALEKEPALRYGQASELKTRVEAIAGSVPGEAETGAVHVGKPKTTADAEADDDIDLIGQWSGKWGWKLIALAVVIMAVVDVSPKIWSVLFGAWIVLFMAKEILGIRYTRRRGWTFGLEEPVARPSGAAPVASGSKTREEASIAGDKAPRVFAPAAIIGLCLAVVPFLIVIVGQAITGPVYATDRVTMFREGVFQWIALVLAGATTVLGWTAAGKIRRSPEKFKGLGIAVFCGLLFPLLGLDFALFYVRFKLVEAAGSGGSAGVDAWTEPFSLIAWAIIVVASDALIGRCAWKRVAGVPDQRGRAAGNTPSSLVAFYFACLSGFIPTVFYWLAPWAAPWLSAEGQMFMLWVALVAALLAIAMGLWAWNSPRGRSAVWMAGVSLSIWVLFFTAGKLSADRNRTASSKRAAVVEKVPVQNSASAAGAAEAWLSLMDKGDYAESWDAAAESFRDEVTKAGWTAESEKIRRPLGEVLSRSGGAIQQVSTFPGMPDGAYWIVEFDTAFAGLKLATEVATFAREKDGQWRVIGYLIRPRTETERAVIVAARAWLEKIDAGDYAASWRDASGYFRSALTEEKWVQALEKVRRPLGERVFRTADACTTTTSLPGVPAGQYVMMQFNASFTVDKSAVETVTFMQEKDGTWRAAGYFIK